MSLGHPAGQTGVYRPVSRGFPVVYYRKTDIFCLDTAGCPRDTGHPGGFQKFYVIFSYVPFLLPKEGAVETGVKRVVKKAHKPWITRMKLLFSNYLGDYSYSFQGSFE